MRRPSGARIWSGLVCALLPLSSWSIAGGELRRLAEGDNPGNTCTHCRRC